MNPVYGARPLKRFLQARRGNPLSASSNHRRPHPGPENNVTSRFNPGGKPPRQMEVLPRPRQWKAEVVWIRTVRLGERGVGPVDPHSVGRRVLQRAWTKRTRRRQEWVRHSGCSSGNANFEVSFGAFPIERIALVGGRTGRDTILMTTRKRIRWRSRGGKLALIGRQRATIKAMQTPRDPKPNGSATGGL